ncbi:hypothetical protein HIM_08993 [Hirsutella minnesotensis 3608]|uniref:BTB domain-containing protein n=1 Tax=Hirsutella minnesotensis 3608 TaxID=1043627 RepID=A0A0F8A3C7_9HYPO|nr:hypothetical protein HIM_08993 [Hirsutella minnesotensis 3608]
MASISFDEITSSPIFRFVVGPKGRQFTIHSALVASQSPALRALIIGGFKESESKEVVWEAVDEKTFVRFCEYIYTGDYQDEVPKTNQAPNKLVLEDELSVASHLKIRHEEEGSGDDMGDAYDSVSGEVKTAKREQQWESFLNAWYPDSRPNRAFQARENDDQAFEYTEVFLCHARLYTFADYHGVAPLMELSIHKLHQILVKFILYDERVEDIVKLLEYCFTTDTPQALRHLLVHYASCQVEKLWEIQAFRDLVGKHGDLSVELINEMLPRLD